MIRIKPDILIYVLFAVLNCQTRLLVFTNINKIPLPLFKRQANALPHKVTLSEI